MTDDPKIYLIDPKTGKAHTSPDGKGGFIKHKLADYMNEPDDDAFGKATDAEIDADIEMLGLSEFLPDKEK